MKMASKAIILDTLTGIVRTEVQNTACELKVFDFIQKGGSTSAEIARNVSCDEDDIVILLDILVSMELLVKRDLLYYNSLVSQRFLTCENPESLRESVILLNKMKNRKFTNLTETIKTKSVSSVPNGHPCPEFTDAAMLIRFQVALKICQTTPEATRLLFGKLDLDKFETITDLGGGLGSLAAQLCAIYPDKHVSVVDLPQAIPECRRYAKEQGGYHSKVTYTEGDFFKSDSLPNSDVYIIQRILHDWTDKQCHVILKNINEALNQGGCVVIIEKLLHDDKTGPLCPTVLGQLSMSLSNLPALERPQAEIEVMLKTRGFNSVKTYNINDCCNDLVVGWK